MNHWTTTGCSTKTITQQSRAGLEWRGKAKQREICKEHGARKVEEKEEKNSKNEIKIYWICVRKALEHFHSRRRRCEVPVGPLALAPCAWKDAFALNFAPFVCHVGDRLFSSFFFWSLCGTSNVCPIWAWACRPLVCVYVHEHSSPGLSPHQLWFLLLFAHIISLVKSWLVASAFELAQLVGGSCLACFYYFAIPLLSLSRSLPLFLFLCFCKTRPAMCCIRNWAQITAALSHCLPLPLSLSLSFCEKFIKCYVWRHLLLTGPGICRRLLVFSTVILTAAWLLLLFLLPLQGCKHRHVTPFAWAKSSFFSFCFSSSFFF